MKGSEFARLIASLSPVAREAAVLKAVEEKLVPEWLTVGPWYPVQTRLVVDGKERTLFYYASPDYFSIGENDDFLRMPILPATLQNIADQFDSIIPSRRMVNSIWGTADCRVEPVPLPNRGPAATDQFVESNARIQAQLDKKGCSPMDSLIAGDKKDIVVGPNMTSQYVVIFGWHKSDGKPIQGWSGGAHDSSYVDYSHGGRLVSKHAMLDGSPVDITSVFLDPKLSPLVSDMGPFLPRFPNSGAPSKVIPASFSPPLPLPVKSDGSKPPPISDPMKKQEEESGGNLGIAAALLAVAIGIPVAIGKMQS